MTPYRQVHVQLTSKDRQEISGLLRKGTQPVRVVARAQVLAQLDRGSTVSQVSANLGRSPKTIRRIAYHYEDDGLERALYDQPRPGVKPLLDASERQRVIAMVCSAPPAGQARWTVRLVVAEAVKRKLVKKVGRETIRVLLLQHDLKPWREKNVVRR